MDDYNYPELRYIDVIPFVREGKRYIYIRDPLEIASSPLIMSHMEFFIVTHFDGLHSLEEIQSLFHKQFPQVRLTQTRIREIIEMLDESYYLANERYHQHSEALMAEYRESTVRPAWHAGSAYAEDAAELKEQIAGFYQLPSGAGLPEKKQLNGQTKIRGILTPHIDLRVGAASYTHAYKPLFEEHDTDLFIILGIAHYGGGGFFIATEKDFETPLGLVETDRTFIRTWEKHAGEKLTREDWAHRIEHSIEFQLPFLQHGMNKPFKIVPILCGAMDPYLANGRKPETYPNISRLLSSLKKTLANYPNAVFILSVDLAHVGPKFGDSFPIDKAKAQEMHDADHRMFDTLKQYDAEAFLEIMPGDLIPRRVDACSAVFTFMHLIENCHGELVNYDQNFQEDTQSMVTYGSMVFRENK